MTDQTHGFERLEKVIAAGIHLERNNGEEILLVRHLEGSDHIPGTVSPPGGKKKPGETHTETAIRELREETGLIVEPHNLTLLPPLFNKDVIRPDNRIQQVVGIGFYCTKFSGELQPTTINETEPFWHPVDKLGELNFVPVILESIIKSWNFLDKYKLRSKNLAQV